MREPILHDRRSRASIDEALPVHSVVMDRGCSLVRRRMIAAEVEEPSSVRGIDNLPRAARELRLNRAGVHGYAVTASHAAHGDAATRLPVRHRRVRPYHEALRVEVVVVDYVAGFVCRGMVRPEIENPM